MNYTKDQVVEHLKKYKTTKEAIDNIDAMGKNHPYIWCTNSRKILFHFDLEVVKTEDRLKKKIHHYMCTNGWEVPEFLEHMGYKETLDYFNLKVRISKPKIEG